MSEANGNGHRRRRRGRGKPSQPKLTVLKQTVERIEEIAKNKREAQAVELRLSGKSYREIAQELGVEYATAAATVKRVLQRDWEVDAEAVNELRQLEINRIDKLWEVYYPRATRSEEIDENGKTVMGSGPSMAAANMCLKLLKRRAELLGLDREIKGTGPIQVNIGTDAIRQMAEAAQDPTTLDALERVAAFLAHGEEAIDAEAEEVDAPTEEPE